MNLIRTILGRRRRPTPPPAALPVVSVPVSSWWDTHHRGERY